ILCVLALCLLPSARVRAGESGRWEKLKEKYAADQDVDRLLFVKYKGNSRARFLMYTKTDDNRWEKLISCDAFVGRRGINKKREGDRKTPTGTFGFTRAFGIKKNPGTSLDYLRVSRYHYWSSRKKDYNRLVDSRKAKGVYGEQLIRYKPQYNYAINIDFNPKNTYGKGSAIFLHCTGSHRYTLGCVAIPEKYMKKVLKNATEHMKICIYRK
ncbi:MAG: L,D-transpeptidase family protein, partial [Eubacterium sp.]|nr:L,D-transpeptidase family protein [Eubacterium sp.]